jgi:hypothetical protein
MRDISFSDIPHHTVKKVSVDPIVSIGSIAITYASTNDCTVVTYNAD